MVEPEKEKEKEKEDDFSRKLERDEAEKDDTKKDDTNEDETKKDKLMENDKKKEIINHFIDTGEKIIKSVINLKKY